MSDIEKLFDDYEQRKKAERTAQEEREAQEQEIQQQSLSTIKTIIIPVLTELSPTIQQRGKEFSFAERLEIHNRPSVVVRFEPSVNKSIAISYASKLHIMVSGLHVYMNEEILGKSGTASSGTVIDGTNAHITAEWFRTQVIAFLERVLKAN